MVLCSLLAAKKRSAILFTFCLISIGSCTGQGTHQLHTSTEYPNKTGQSKLRKTQGSNEYQDISCGLEDKKGNLWFGTSGEGIYRYDGKLFTQFTVQDGLSSNAVHCLLEDKSGNIWIGTKNGLDCFDGTNIKQIPINVSSPLISFTPGNGNSSLVETEVFSILQDRQGMLWIGTTNGMYCYDGKNFTDFLNSRSPVNDSLLTLKSVQCLYEDKNGNIWFGSGPMAFEGLSFYDGKTLTKVKLGNETWIRRIMKDKNGNLLLATRHIGAIIFNGTSFVSMHGPKDLDNGLMNCTYSDHNGFIWYASDYVKDNDISTGGLWKFDGTSFSSYGKNDGLTNTSVTLILEDSKNNIWLGTRNVGVYKFDGKTITQLSE